MTSPGAPGTEAGEVWGEADERLWRDWEEMGRTLPGWAAVAGVSEGERFGFWLDARYAYDRGMQRYQRGQCAFLCGSVIAAVITGDPRSLWWWGTAVNAALIAVGMLAGARRSWVRRWGVAVGTRRRCRGYLRVCGRGRDGLA